MRPPHVRTGVAALRPRTPGAGASTACVTGRVVGLGDDGVKLVGLC